MTKMKWTLKLPFYADPVSCFHCSRLHISLFPRRDTSRRWVYFHDFTRFCAGVEGERPVDAALVGGLMTFYRRHVTRPTT